MSSQILKAASAANTYNIDNVEDGTLNITKGETSPTTVLGLSTNGITSFGGRLKFPATQNASSDVNTLDDYEEGSFTPTLDSGTCSGTCYYTKIGRVVHMHGAITHTGNGSGLVGVTINNLPFTSITTDLGTFGHADWSGITLDGSDTAAYSFISSGGSTLLFGSSPSGSGIDASRWLTGARLSFNITYFAAF